jgi:hypothetical protein
MDLIPQVATSALRSQSLRLIPVGSIHASNRFLPVQKVLLCLGSFGDPSFVDHWLQSPNPTTGHAEGLVLSNRAELSPLVLLDCS